MKGTEKIIAHIQADAKAQADAILAQAELQCAEIRQSYETKAKERYGEKIRQLQEWNTETKLLDEAVIDLSAKLELLRRILAENGDDDDFTPQAS